MRVFHAVQLAVLAVLLFCSTGQAKAAHHLAADITGKVVDASQQPVVGATVVIEQLETGRVLIRKTNNQGRYHANNVRHDGTYRVTVISLLGNTYSFTGSLQHGYTHRRNFVVDTNSSQPPAFARSWVWNMSKATLGTIRS